ncbi:MAG: pyruvate carboxylase [Thermaerobacter sp.]|nr:pyruvate carboxylase [Thermaerobacter sp.]
MAVRPFRKVLVANRGEVAIRIFRACTELGIQTVAVYHHEDRNSLYRLKADEAYRVGDGLSPVEAYLDVEGLVGLAQDLRVDAIHPGYGFLSESAEFARACAGAGIAFIGPSPEILEAFGDKAMARRIAQQAGVPVLPGTDGALDVGPLVAETARRLGYPLAVKAIFGGGGRGIRMVRDEGDLQEALENAQSEAERAFGRPQVYLERYVESARHIEVQVLGDRCGQIVHLHERDCSVQRRHQKLVEVAPAVNLDPDVAQGLKEAALRLMRDVRYENAGTVEFIVTPRGEFFFLEVNPRLQVEHTITEIVTGIDIVQSQIRIAQGYLLSDPEIGIGDQGAVRLQGAAIQCRVTTEDPKHNFLPDTGRILAYRSAGGQGIRLDGAGTESGAIITPYYDSLLVKCITFGPTFSAAAAKMLRALREFRVRGVRTNLRFLEEVVGHPAFLGGAVDTGFVDRTPELAAYEDPRDRGNKLLAYIGEVTVNGVRSEGFGEGGGPRREATRAYTPTGSRRPPAAPQGGLRPLLMQGGPAAVVARLRADGPLYLTDTTYRDGHQSLLATRVRTHDLLEAAREADYMDKLFSLEMWGGATFDTAIRFLKESPWDRLERLRRQLPQTLFQMLLRGSNAVGYSNYPDDLVRRFVREAAEAGIDVFRIFDSLNWVEGMKVAIEAALETGRLVEGTICYSGDCADPGEDVFTVEYYLGLATQLKALGVHLIAVKDMAGLLVPRSARLLVGALQREIGLPVHLHTHDTAGAGVSAVLAAAEAGAAIADVAVASMAGGTSQPSMTAIVAALRGGARDTGLSLDACDRGAETWGRIRRRYRRFEVAPGEAAVGVYAHEMPGGQYTNLRAQTVAAGLGARWPEVVEAYCAVDRLLGRIVKVTPSSKAVGDFAIFLVREGLGAQDLSEEALGDKERLQRLQRRSFPESVVQLLSGQMGQPPRPFPPKLQALVLQGAEPILGRAGAQLPAVDLEALQRKIAPRAFGSAGPRDALSYSFYPRPWDELQAHLRKYGNIAVLDTETFFEGLAPGDEIEVEIDPGMTLVVRLTAISDADRDGMRILYFELNGSPRSIVVADRSVAGAPTRRQADPADPQQLGSPMPGQVVRIMAQPGAAVRRGDPLIALEAMKMEVLVRASDDGQVQEVAVRVDEKVGPGDLLLVVCKGKASATR